jgi:hypothetical protein
MHRLEIIEAIRDRKAKYCRYLDTKQFDAWERLFAPDARITFYAPDGAVLLENADSDDAVHLFRFEAVHLSDVMPSREVPISGSVVAWSFRWFFRSSGDLGLARFS